MKLRLKWWWYVTPAYLTGWTTIFSLWNLIDGSGMMKVFGVDIGEPTPFIMLNSASRYVAIALGMIVGIWVFRTFHSILTVLLIRLMMDLLDLYSGFVTGLIDSPVGIVQSCIMFILPNLFAILTLLKFRHDYLKNKKRDEHLLGK